MEEQKNLVGGETPQEVVTKQAIAKYLQSSIDGQQHIIDNQVYASSYREQAEYLKEYCQNMLQVLQSGWFDDKTQEAEKDIDALLQILRP